MSCISVNVERKYGIFASAFRNDGINASASRREGIIVSVALFCDVGIGKYLLVTPTETQWVTVEIGANYDVNSNTNWNIE